MRHCLLDITTLRKVISITMKESTRQKDQIYAKWLLRPAELRHSSHVESFADELWGSGLRLSRNANTHYQLVMEAIRSAVQW